MLGVLIIVIVYVCESDSVPFVAVTVNVYVPEVVGLPKISPLLDSARPSGISPEILDHVTPSMLTVSVTLYARPTIPPDSVSVIIVSVSIIVIVYDFEDDSVPFVAVTVNVYVPEVVGVPEIDPVLAFRLSHVGRPEADHVTPVVLAMSVALYSSPTLPPLSAVVVIASDSGVGSGVA